MSIESTFYVNSEGAITMHIDLVVLEFESRRNSAIRSVSYSEIFLAKMEFDGHIEAIMNSVGEPVWVKGEIDWSEFREIKEKIWRVALIEAGKKILFDTKLTKINNAILPQPVVVNGRIVKHDEQNFFHFKRDYFENNHG